MQEKTEFRNPERIWRYCTTFLCKIITKEQIRLRKVAGSDPDPYHMVTHYTASVADRDQGSGAFLTLGSGIRDG